MKAGILVYVSENVWEMSGDCFNACELETRNKLIWKRLLKKKQKLGIRAVEGAWSQMLGLVVDGQEWYNNWSYW